MKYLERVKDYLHSFGWKDGIYITILQALRGIGIRFRNETAKKMVFVRTLNQKVCIRPGTTDYDLLLDFFFKREGAPLHYDIDFVRLLHGESPRYVLDAGANIGLFSLLCDQRYHPEKLLAVEPESSNFELLSKNASRRDSIVCIQSGIWKSRSQLRIIPSTAGKWGVKVEECASGGDVSGISISDLMDEYKIPCFDIVKMDIEGSEYYVMKDSSCEEWLNKTKVLVIETHDVLIKESTATVMSRMSSLGFRSFTEGEDIVFYR